MKKSKELVMWAIFIVILVSFAAAAQAGVTIRDFNDNVFPSDLIADRGRYKVANGRMEISGVNPLGHYDVAMFTQMYTNMKVVISAGREPDGQNGAYGIILYGNGIYLLMDIMPDGYYHFNKFDSSTLRSESLIGNTQSSHIFSDGRKNVLELVKNGDDYTLFANGNELATCRDVDSFKGGSVQAGFSSYTYNSEEGLTWFDDFSVTPLGTLNVRLNSPEIGKVTGQGIDCGMGGVSCSKDVGEGNYVTLSFASADGWKFDYTQIGGALNLSNPLTIRVDQVTDIVPKFSPDPVAYWLMPDDNTPLGGRTAIVLAHGNGNNDNAKNHWGKFIKWANRYPGFSAKYKIYNFRWNCDDDNLLPGLALGALIDRYPKIKKRPFIILGHSRGGLVARYYMNNYTLWDINGNWGVLAGEAVKNLFTLATPHHGSPGADKWWVDFSINHVFSQNFLLARKLGKIYKRDIWKPSYEHLLWDDYDQEIMDGTILWQSAYLGFQSKAFQSAGTTAIYGLNEAERYYQKFICFGGNNFTRQENIWDVLDSYAIIDEHSRLDLGSFLMAFMVSPPNDYGLALINEAYLRFQANDGMVPLSSALCLTRGSGNLFRVNKKGILKYDLGELEKHKQVKKIIFFPNKYVDHLHFLDNEVIVNKVIRELMGVE